MSQSLTRIGARGGGVTLAAQAGRMLVQLIGLVVLSRLLEPEDFGLVAMVAVFMTLADILRDFGLSSAGLQARALSQQQASNLFWASTALGLFAGILLAAGTPLIVSFYDEPRLWNIIPALATVLLIGGTQAQVQVQLARQHKFLALALSQFVAPVVGLMLAVIAALAGWDYMALVAQIIGTATALLLLQSAFSRWIPSTPKRGHGSAALFRSGAQMGGAFLLTWAASNVDSMLTGARFGASTLGFYNRAYQLTATIIGSFLAPLTQVVVPILNEARKDGKNTSVVLRNLQFFIAAPVSLIMVALAAVAPLLIPILLGDAWAPAIPLVQILAVGECIHALSFVSYWGFLAERLSKQLLYYNLLTKPLVVIAVFLGSSWGVEGIAWGYVVGLAVSWPINLLWLDKSAGYEGMKFLTNGLRILLVALVTYALVSLILNAFAHSGSFFWVIAAVVITIVLFISFLAILPSGRNDLRRVIQAVRSLR
jgi:PST family polysaccharide transporter